VNHIALLQNALAAFGMAKGTKKSESANERKPASESARRRKVAKTPKEDDDFIQQIRQATEYLRIQKTLWKRWRQLGRSKEFVWETARLKFQLGNEVHRNSARVRRLFTPNFPVVPGQRIYLYFLPNYCPSIMPPKPEALINSVIWQFRTLICTSQHSEIIGAVVNGQIGH
jgi:hypothetical protein